MASLFGTAIVAFCATTATGKYNDACTKAMDAGTRQVGLRQSIDKVEDGTVNYVNASAMKVTPKPIQEAVGSGLYVYKVARDKKLTFKVPTLGFCSSMTTELEPNRYALVLRWNLQ